ncbi:6,7-dimethyl-8-ribityllumazine synthase [Buchnera aphidicola]|uniref:6,7-dimethyl-8-ribityllumazine synthase n=1 Tax=Buchnera aphidicola (Aphis gossypii) TaxID=98785 RepID=A0A5J6ZCD4_9GAMM|nr:6,7-dimethyl-8-ribityllumazine synthase [Buchnera aphidicola]QFQ32267.1 6,7-dimethyl-8-ribityllumazine synthase [Buchnera aphidicola (Aphis gossypii)]UPT14791.1 6,7-dimethyl-8-ribityllumazine synthase [Buchnera aphidicola (Aphis gossypii)]
MKIIQSGITRKTASIAIIISRFNQFINNNLLFGALDTLKRIGQIKEDNIFKIYVPGAYEIPLIAKYIAKNKKYDAIITIGAIIKGSTDHFKYIASDVYNNLSKISIKYLIPITLGILTTNNLEQSIERSGLKMGNKGSEAALAALEMINIIKQLKEKND